MRFQALLGYGASFVALWHFGVAVASPVDSPEPEVLAVASFAESNTFGHVVNGESNKIFVTIENKSDRNITLENIAGSFAHPQTSKLVKNTTAQTYKLPLLEGGKLQLPYEFYSEFKPGDLRLSIWLEHTADGEKYRVTAYDSIVTIVEPEGSIFDIKLWLTYIMVLAIVGGSGYLTYVSFVPQPKKRRTPAVSAPVGTVTATGAGGYQEEWIPEHHLKKPKAKKGKGAVSGEETSGTELSGTEGRKRKGKK